MKKTLLQLSPQHLKLIEESLNTHIKAHGFQVCLSCAELIQLVNLQGSDTGQKKITDEIRSDLMRTISILEEKTKVMMKGPPIRVTGDDYPDEDDEPPLR